MVVIDIVREIKETIKFDSDDYIISTNKLHLWKFYNKVRKFTSEEVYLIFKQFCDEKKKPKITFIFKNYSLKKCKGEDVPHEN